MKRHAPATERNRDAIASVLATALPDNGTVLEIASGTGEHVAHFAARFPALSFQPSDPDVDARASIAAWCADLSNVHAPLALDAAADHWPVVHADAILCINMVHISPWAATLGLMAGAGRLLPAGAPLILYGAYREQGVETASSNEAFEQWLKQKSPEFGLRYVEDVAEAASQHGLTLQRRVEMPANNLMLIFRAGATFTA